MKESRSTVLVENLQEMLDASAGSTKHTLHKAMAQYFTPPWFARQMAELIPNRYACTVVCDPQRGTGNLLEPFSGRGTYTFGSELDRRLAPEARSERLVNSAAAADVHLTASCLDVWRLLDEFYPALTFRCQVANPPFGLRWQMHRFPGSSLGDGLVHDSTEATWLALRHRSGHSGVGYMIAGRGTIERLNLHRDRSVWLYQTFPVGIFDADVEIGVLHFADEHVSSGGPGTGVLQIDHISAEPEAVRRTCEHIDPPDYYPDGSDQAEVWTAFNSIERILAEEKRDLPPFNVYLDARGYLRTYLSVRHQLQRKLTVTDVEKLAKINQCHPLTLTTERDTRLLLDELVLNGTYTVQPEARAAVQAALAEMAQISCPLMPITDFERVAYADENEALLALPASRPLSPVPGEQPIKLTPGKRYPTTTGSYSWKNKYQRMRLHLDTREQETYAAQHDVELSGQDRFITFTDDAGVTHRFLDRPDYTKKVAPFDHSDELLWSLFAKPEVQTIAEKQPNDVRKNIAVMEACELLGGFEYYDGQRDFYARVAVRNYALVGAATGTGKTLGAITLIALKAPQRALIVAPQGTTRGRKADDEDSVEDLQASQWITELRRFAPGLQVFELFCEADYDRILALNAGVLPHGVYVSYYEAMFSNGARESASENYTDAKFLAAHGLPVLPEHTATHAFTASIGDERRGIRCIAAPCLASRIGHKFDFVALDEAHKMCHLSANVTQMIVRLQPRYRYALTATPIPNLVTDIFPLMGWLCVPGWYRKGLRNAAWPYAREDGYRFSTTFLSTERDLTQEKMNRDADPNWRGKCERASPVISSPARLLKLIKPTMAFISKEACNPLKPKVTIHDVRVPMGRQQAKLYGFYMNRANVPHANPMVRAAVQVAILRDLCAAPAASRWNCHTGLQVRSPFNPKIAAILSLIRDILARGQQVVVVNARVKQSDYLERRLAEAGITCARIDSSRPAERHTEEANLFKRGRAPVMIMGIKCAQAHSFDQCPNLIVGSLEYTFGSFEQASGRIDRVTSKRPMNIWCVLHQNTIEEILFDIVATKGDAATICLRGQRVPRDYKAADLGEILAKNFEAFTAEAAKDGLKLLPDEPTVEAGWPQLCKALRAALAEHPCQLAR